MLNEYRIVESTGSDDLSSVVAQFLDSGWKLHGPLILSYEPAVNEHCYGTTWLRQVVVRGPNT